MGINNRAYGGKVVFVAGTHYAVDEEGHADLERPMIMCEDGVYHEKTDSDMSHQDTYHQRSVTVGVSDLGEEV